MAWAACNFIAQLQYWWVVIELASFNEARTIGKFLLLRGLPLMLFAAAALVLPQTELPEGADLLGVVQSRWPLGAPLPLHMLHLGGAGERDSLEALSALVLERTRRSHGRRLATRVQFHFLAAGAGDHHRPLHQPHTLGVLATLPEVLLTGAAEPIAIGARVPPMLPRCPVRV
jgi:hypothetical protein